LAGDGRFDGIVLQENGVVWFDEISRIILKTTVERFIIIASWARGRPSLRTRTQPSDHKVTFSFLCNHQMSE